MKKSWPYMRLLLTLLLLPFVSIAQRFVHPGVPFTRYDLDLLKQNIAQEPWLTDYNAFKSDGHSQLSYVMRGPAVNVSRAPNLNNTIWQQDMIAIHNLAFMWIFTGDTAYARKATDILDAWAVTNTTWGGTESMLDIGDYAQYWATGADILKSTYPGWTTTNTTHVNNYFANVLYPTSYVPYPLRDQNKGALQLKIALGAAAFLDDTLKFNQAIEVYRMDAGGGLRNSLPNGEVGDAGRDDHWRVQAAALAWGAEVAYKQGIDMYSELNNRMLAIGELYPKYSFDGDTMTFIPFGGYASYWTNWGIQPGIITGDMTNTIKAAYNLRKGIATPQTDRMRVAIGGTGGNFLFLKSADTSTAVALTPIVYPGDNVQAVTHLTNLDIGNSGISGSAVYNNGTWTVKGAGTSLSNAFNYTFQRMAGNAAVVIRVDTMSESAGGCGIMVRQSLAANANYWNIHLAGIGGIGRHWQPKAPWWMKMERVGTRIFAYHSQDGVNWTNLLCFYEPNNYTDSLYYGFYAISNNASALNTARFSNVAFSQSSPAGAPQITSPTAAHALIRTAFYYTITASNNPVSYSAAGLPDGLTLNSTTGVISGIPTTIGTYAVTLYATNAAGTSTTILILRVSNNTAPAIPVGVTATVVNTSNIRLSWTAADSITSYTVKRSLNSGGPYTTLISGVTTNAYIDISPTPEVPNYYVITALSDTLESGISAQVSASVPPRAPGQPAITLGNSQLQLSWATGAGAVTYNVKRSSFTGGPYTLITNTAGTTYTDTAVTNGTPYYYVVTSVGKSLESGNSPEGFGVPGANAYVWDDAPVSENWSDTANWVDKAPPTSPAILTFKVTEDSVSNNDLTNLSTVRILFDTTASSYTISGNTIYPGNEIINNSSRAQTFNTPLVLNTDIAINAKTQNISLNGLITGTGNIKNIGRNTVFIKGLNTYSGNTTIWGDGSGGLSYAIGMAGTGTGTPGNPTSGPLGTGKIILDGGSLYSEYGSATLYNDIEVLPGKKSYLYEGSYAIILYGKLTGSGTLWHDCNTYAGCQMYGDNSGFTGTFVNALRSGNNRLRFNVPESGSANAIWNLDANGIDCQSLNFPTGTIHFGALTGRGYFRNNAGGAPVMSIGALNISTWFSGTINGTIGVEKVGTGDLEFGGNHTYSSATTIRNGRFLLTNNASTGVFVSPITVVGGTFAGTGRTTGPVTIGTGAALEPGKQAIGTLTTTATLTMQQDAIFNVEINPTTGLADKMVAGAVILNNAKLAANLTVPDSLTTGAAFTIIDNTGSNAVTGQFNGLPELAPDTIGGYVFRITYKGGTGNDVVLMDDRTVPLTITSALNDTVLTGRTYTYTITAIKAPTTFSASGLPAGVSINASTGVISGIPAIPGIYPVLISASNGVSNDTTTLQLVVKSNIVDGVIVAAGDAKNIVEWNRILDLTYNVKRSANATGPYTTIASDISTVKYTDSAVTNGSTYYYVVSSSEGGNSAVVMATPNAGQMGYYRFNEAGTTRCIDSWGANHATLQSGASHVQGYTGNAIQCNGTASSYATLPAGIVNNFSAFTIAAWVNMSAISTWMRVFDFGNSTTQYMFLTPQAGLSGGKSIVRYAIKNGSAAEQSISFNYTFPLSTWVHLAVTQSTTATTLYINGAAVATATNITLRPTSLGSTSLNYLGKSQFADPILNGAIDELKIYNRALSATEIQTISQAKVTQAIIFDTIANKYQGDTAFALGGVATSGLAVTYASTDTTVATVVEGNVHVRGVGTTTIIASQSGNQEYDSAVSVSQPITVLPLALQVQHADGSSDNNIKPYLKLVNNGTLPIPYSQLKVRYWFTAENYTGINTWIDYAAMGNDKINMQYVELPAPRTGALGYLEYSFDTTAGNLFPNSNSGVIQSSFANADWSVLNKTDDYSYQANANYNSNPQITMYRNDALVWGTEPVIVPSELAVHALTQSKSAGSNTISNLLQLQNTGNLPANYTDLKVRYWFTRESESTLNFWLDYAKSGNGTVTGQFVNLPTSSDSADTYLELSFASSSGKLYPLSGTGDVDYRITKQDWSDFNQANDYSYRAPAAISPNPKVTVYYQGTLIYGNEPVTSSLRRTGKPELVKTIARVYPNPAHHVLCFVPASKHPSGIRIQIIDIHGKVVQQVNVGAYAGGAVTIQLNSNIVPGVYWVVADKELPLKIVVE